MKNKTLALLEVAIVLFSVLLVATLPAAAITNYESGITNYEEAAQEDKTLDIYGNANEDGTIDMRDLTYVKLIFFGKKPETELADAKYDGKINPLDFIQIKLIIVGKEKELTIVDSAGNILTVSMPIERIVTLTDSSPEVLRSLGTMDKIVGVDTYTITVTDYYPELGGLPTVGAPWEPDYEAIISLNPDIALAYSGWPAELEDKLQGTDIVVVRLDFHLPYYTSEVARLGYVLNEKEKAAEVIEFHQNYMSLTNEEIEGLSEEEKPRVYLEWNPDYMTDTHGSLDQLCTMAGGINIAADLSGMYPTVEPEWVIRENPNIIVKFPFRSTAAHGYDVADCSEMDTLRDGIMDRDGFGGIVAVENGEVYIVGQELVGGPRTLIAVAYMAKWFHPELFEDLDPKAIHQEYITEFQGLDYDLDKQGLFVYHPEENPDGN